METAVSSSSPPDPEPEPDRGAETDTSSAARNPKTPPPLAAETAVPSSSPPAAEPDRGAEADASSAPPNPSAERGEGEKEEEAEEEEAECGFCLFMKGGGCKEAFIAWEKCVEEAEKSGEDMVEKCFQVTSLLRKCMDAHADYYEPILKAEQEIAESVAAGIKDPPQSESEEVKEKVSSTN